MVEDLDVEKLRTTALDAMGPYGGWDGSSTLAGMLSEIRTQIDHVSIQTRGENKAFWWSGHA